jgi:hypothetical protein
MDAIFASSLIKYFELAAGLIGLFCWYKKPNSVWLLFSVYLLLLFGMEYLGSWLGKHKLYEENSKLYKWLVIPSLVLMYHLVFYKILREKKGWIIVSASIFGFLAIVENVFLNKTHNYSISITQSFGCLSIAIASIMYFLQLVKTDEILLFYKDMGFWFSLALLLFYVGSFAKLTFFNSLGLQKNAVLFNLVRWIFIYLNYIMYSLFAIGYIWSKPK